MPPKNISEWHLEQIIVRNWGMMLIHSIRREHKILIHR
jgi:hypothetical protein